MADLTIESITGKLNRVGYDAFMQSLHHAKKAGNRNVELAHWMAKILQMDRTDVALTVDHYKLDRAKLMAELNTAIQGFGMNKTEMPGISENIMDAILSGWHYATLYFGETQIRTGHILVAILKDLKLRRVLSGLSKQFEAINVEALSVEHARIWRGSDEENLRPIDGSGLRGAGTPGAETAPGTKGTTALDRFSTDLTEKAREGGSKGGLDPIVGRDHEIRQVVDVLMRRRQNNPILTGEAGVGKTAVVEGFAQRIAAGDVPPALANVRLCALDIGLMQAGAAMKGEFEQRLRSVIDEVQASPQPVILFIDEAHTLIGAGGAAGTGDAANLLKPALARGTLRTIAATTWSEYRQHIEKDPALTRRFQPIHIDEPDVARCCDMVRGLLKNMEAHHKVRISDAAVVAAVQLSHRYIPARQLPDKAVSLLDTACARVAISQTTIPAMVEDTRISIARREAERAALVSDSDLGSAEDDRIAELDTEIAGLKERLELLDAEWATEKGVVEKIQGLWAKLTGKKETAEAAAETEASSPADAPSHAETPLPADGLEAAPPAGDDADPEESRKLLRESFETLEARAPESRMIYPFVDEQAIASVVSDWTGIPVGRMVRDEVQTILTLGDLLARRVIGQDHGLNMIAKRIETNRAKLDNPNKPIGVFMLAGPSGVGKTETALALAEQLYGGEQNMITINMSEFQEAHTVSTLKGAPPGYVGYGEGGRLTEAVRRKPYSVVLLDEIEKAHADVHEIFFQVFDKGEMEDGTGRRIDFKNTLIILTTNVGTDVIMGLSRDPHYRDNPEELAQALRPELLKVFPPALLGRIVTIPYFPLSDEMLSGIVRLQLDRIARRIRENHEAAFLYDDSVVAHIVSRCNDPDTGGRMIDNIITNTLLPALSREFLKLAMDKHEVNKANVTIENDEFAYTVT